MRAHMELAKQIGTFPDLQANRESDSRSPAAESAGNGGSLPVTLVAPSPLFPAESGNGERRIGDLGVCR